MRALLLRAPLPGWRSPWACLSVSLSLSLPLSRCLPMAPLPIERRSRNEFEDLYRKRDRCQCPASLGGRSAVAGLAIIFLFPVRRGSSRRWAIAGGALARPTAFPDYFPRELRRSEHRKPPKLPLTERMAFDVRRVFPHRTLLVLV